MTKLLAFPAFNTCKLCSGNISTTHWICTQFSQADFQIKFFRHKTNWHTYAKTESLVSDEWLANNTQISQIIYVGEDKV